MLFCQGQQFLAGHDTLFDDLDALFGQAGDRGTYEILWNLLCFYEDSAAGAIHRWKLEHHHGAQDEQDYSRDGDVPLAAFQHPEIIRGYRCLVFSVVTHLTDPESGLERSPATPVARVGSATWL